MIKRLFLPFERATKFRTASLLKLQRRNFHPEVKQAFSQTTSEHTSAEDTYELLKQEIIKKRVAIFRLPLGIQPIEVPYTLSNLAGHGSFIFLAVSYLESDVMSLRVYAVSGITLSILFQYYREVPLWIPIRWNALFLLINVTMILLLIKEATDANNIPEEQQHLYMMVFQRAGMKPEDFLRLMATAERKEVPKGEKLVQQGRRHQQLHLIQSGKLSVMRDHNQIGVIEAQQFAGAMSFLTWEGNYEIHNNLKREGEGEFLLWDEFSDSGFGGLKMNIPKALPVTSSASHGLSGSGSAESESSADNHHAESESHDSEIDWEMGYADVTCEEDCIVYSWSFKDLHEMLAHNPRMGLVVEGCISKDLNRKMTATWLVEPHQKYRQILYVALTDGEVTAKERRGFAKFRREHNIGDAEHVELLKECGWTVAEYESGKKKMIRHVEAAAGSVPNSPTGGVYSSVGTILGGLATFTLSAIFGGGVWTPAVIVTGPNPGDVTVGTTGVATGPAVIAMGTNTTSSATTDNRMGSDDNPVVSTTSNRSSSIDSSGGSNGNSDVSVSNSDSSNSAGEDPNQKSSTDSTSTSTSTYNSPSSGLTGRTGYPTTVTASSTATTTTSKSTKTTVGGPQVQLVYKKDASGKMRKLSIEDEKHLNAEMEREKEALRRHFENHW